MSNSTQRIPGYCALCIASCGCISVVENDRLIKVEPNPSHPTGKALCSKGRSAPELVYNEERLLYPLRRTTRKDDPHTEWERISWDQALSTTAQELKRLATQNGSECVTFSLATSAGTAMQDGYPWVERLRNAFGSPNVVASMELCNFTKEFIYPHTFGVGMPMADLEHTGCVVLWGHNPSSTWLPHGARVASARARGAKLIVVDPRRIGLAAKADQWLRVRPGSDGALALGIAGILIKEALFDRDFIQNWSNGVFLVRNDNGRMLTGSDLSESGNTTMRVAWDLISSKPVLYDVEGVTYEMKVSDLALSGEFNIWTTRGEISCRPVFQLYQDLCLHYSPERVEKLTDIPAKQLYETARLIGSAGPVSLYTWAGIEQHSNSVQNSRAISLLYALTGSFDDRGGNVLFEKVAVQDVTGSGLMPDSLQLKTLGLSERPLGPEAINNWITTDSLYTAVLDQKPYPVKGLVSFGGNILMSHSDGLRGAKALNALEFMVHADIFMSPTAQHADIILPVNTPWEREGLRTDFMVSQEASGYVQLRPAVLESRGESQSDAWIAFELAKRLGYSEQFWQGNIDDAYCETLKLSGVSLKDLRKNPGGIKIPLKTSYKKYSEHGLSNITGFDTPSRKIELYSEAFAKHGYAPLPEYMEPGMGSADKAELLKSFPLILTSAKSSQYLGSQGRAVSALRRIEPEPCLEIHPDTALVRGLKNGDAAALVTPHGKIQMQVKFSPNLHPNVVVGVHGWWQGNPLLMLPSYNPLSRNGANLNALFANETIDPIDGAAPHKAYACEVTAID